MKLDEGELKQGIFVIAIFALGGFLFWSLNGFFNAFLGASVFYIILRRPYFYLLEQKKWNKQLTIVLLLLLSFVLLILPLFLISFMLAGKISYAIQHYEELLLVLQQWSTRAKEYIGIDLVSQETVGKLTAIAANAAPKFLSATAGTVLDIFVVYFLLYFMFANARKMEANVRLYLPFHEENNELLLKELKRQTMANAIGIPILVVLMGVTATLGYWAFGVGNPIFWGAITGLGSVIPVIGIGAIWVPIVVYLFISGHTWNAVGLTIYCAAMFTLIEYGFRLLILKKLGDMPPVITFFGVFLGLELFGFVGVIFGPLLISYFILLLKIYRNEYLDEPH